MVLVVCCFHLENKFIRQTEKGEREWGGGGGEETHTEIESDRDRQRERERKKN